MLWSSWRVARESTSEACPALIMRIVRWTLCAKSAVAFVSNTAMVRLRMLLLTFIFSCWRCCCAERSALAGGCLP